MDAGYKKCSTCGEEKSKTQFYKNKRAKDGLQSQCTVCANERLKEYQGMKRAEMSELKDMIHGGELEYKLELKRLYMDYEAKVAALALRHGRNMADAIREFKNGSTYLKNT